MRKKQGEKRNCKLSQVNGRVLARALAENLHGVAGGLRPTNNLLTATLTNLDDLKDTTFRGGDGDSA